VTAQRMAMSGTTFCQEVRKVGVPLSSCSSISIEGLKQQYSRTVSSQTPKRTYSGSSRNDWGKLRDEL